MVPGIFTIIEYLNGSPQRFQQKQPWKAESRALTPCCKCTFRVSSSLVSVLFLLLLGHCGTEAGKLLPYACALTWLPLLTLDLGSIPQDLLCLRGRAGAGGGNCSGGLLHRTLVSWEIRLTGARWKWQKWALFGIGCPPGDKRCDIV